ncbi:diacylglycerol kinase zeta-like [Tachypleus tridentatus]|uniref:diacylglycerol kinase zeta-like n=1 Tax=Tachypleus tridentatus TaxID=6853 RepID=UPI003FD00345
MSEYPNAKGRLFSMHKLRETFKKSRGPAIEAPLPPSAPFLDVPKQLRSASFDEIRFSKEEELGEYSSSHLSVPTSKNQRSRSLDSAAGTTADSGSSLDVPRWRLRRRTSSEKTQSSQQCLHCLYLEEYARGDFSRCSSLSEKSLHFSSSSEAIESETEVAKIEDGKLGQVRAPTHLDLKNCPVVVTLCSPSSDGTKLASPTASDLESISLEVPSQSKQIRSISVDSPFLNVPGREEVAEDDLMTYRSRSVDIVLPTTTTSGYTVHTSTKKKTLEEESRDSTDDGDTRTLQSTPDWSEAANTGDHIWVSTSASSDLCYVGENDCSKQGLRVRCPACKMSLHTGCISILTERNLQCKPTFKDVGIRQYREQTVIFHHWVHRRQQKGRCQQCGKLFQSKLSFGNKEIVAIGCSWCKLSFHNKSYCFSIEKLSEHCSLGVHADIIVPPTWIVKLPRKGSFKSSLRRSPKKRLSTKKKLKKEDDKEQTKTFVIKPIPSVTSKPLLVFLNPKSGSNQGAKLMQKFQWLLNPRQVFDLTQGGPFPGLELYKKVPNLRVLACGGDGTVGWVLSILDEIGISPPVSVLPLGTGNDLARSLGWGGGYTDEPISKILSNIQDGDVIQLDRWNLHVEKNIDVDLFTCEEGKENLPLNVVNNYFSLGVDAHIALEFHEAREAHPEKFNSRLRNKMFYGQAGGKDLLQRKWKDLCNFVTLECDGQDLTPRLKELRIHAILFLNIPSYGGGTRPWVIPGPGFDHQRTDDGVIEVIGLTTYQLPLLQAGGHGTCLAQCQTARMITNRTIPVQVDGEPCKLLPSVISLHHRNKANMVARARRQGFVQSMPTLEKLTIEVKRLNMTDYETYHYDKEKLRYVSMSLGCICVDLDSDLEQLRTHVNHILEDKFGASIPAQLTPQDWCFLDSCTAERFFRIDRAQEHLYYVSDISSEDLFILDPEAFLYMDSSNKDMTECLENNCSNALEMVKANDEENYEIAESSLESHLNSRNDTGALAGDVVSAVKNCDLAKLKDLHQNGYNLQGVDQQGMTALHYAAQLGLKDIVSYLLASGFSSSTLDMVDHVKGQTALHMAVINKHGDICDMLISAGASLHKMEKQGMTPSQLASSEGYEDLAAYLESSDCSCFWKEEMETSV